MKNEKKAVEIVQRSMGSLVDYRSLMLDNSGEVASARFHHEWSDILLHANESYAIEGFRECAKSSYVGRAFPLHALTFPRYECSYILFIMANTSLAEKKLKGVWREFFSNPLISSSVVKVIEQSGSAFEVVLAVPKSKSSTGKMSVRLEAYGKGSSVRGALWGTRRPDIVVMDDVQDSDTAKSDTMLSDDWDWFMDDIVFLGRHTRIFMIGNNLGEKCIIERVHNEPGNFGFKTMKVPICDVVDESGKAAWPEMFSMDYIIEEREKYKNDLTTWTRNRMCECIAEEDKEFRREDFRYYPNSEMNKIASKCNIYMRIDPAVQLKENSDFSAFIVFGINEDNYWFIFEVVYGRMKQSEKIDTVFHLHKKWPQMRNGGTENSKEGLILIQDVRDQMAKRNQFFKFVEIPLKNVAKEVRVSSVLEPRFKSNTIWFPERADWLTEMEQELLMFSKHGKTALHDDLIDCLSQGDKETQAPITGTSQIQRTAKFKNLPRRGKVTCIAR